MRGKQYRRTSKRFDYNTSQNKPVLIDGRHIRPIGASRLEIMCYLSYLLKHSETNKPKLVNYYKMQGKIHSQFLFKILNSAACNDDMHYSLILYFKSLEDLGHDITLGPHLEKTGFTYREYYKFILCKKPHFSRWRNKTARGYF